MHPLTDQVTGPDAVDIVDIADEVDLIAVRQLLRAHARAAKLSLVEETKFITAGSELARNIVTHTTTRQGEVRIEQLCDNGRTGVRAAFADQGPGISDLDAALTDGFSTAGSLGLGLPGARRLVDEMTIDTAGGSGTTVVISKWKR